MIYFLKKMRNYLKWSEIVEPEVNLFQVYENRQPRYLGNMKVKIVSIFHG